MLVRRMLPCKRRLLRMCEFNPEGPWTIKHFFGLTLEGMCNLEAGHFIYIYYNHYSDNPSVARNGSIRRRESGVRRHFPKARPVPLLQRCWAGRSAKSLQGKAKDRAVKPNFTRYASRPGKSLPILWRIAGKGRPKPPPHAGRRGPPPKTWRRRRPSKGRKHHQRALPRRAPSPCHAHQRASPPPSRKLLINSKV